MFAGLGLMGGGGAADDRRLSTEEVREARERGRGGGALTVHAVVRWEGAPHNSQEKDVRAAKMRQYNSESRAPQYVP